MERDLEKGIKRFLKRRVKITLGFVVAFLLSCTSFAVTEQTITDKNIWLEGLGAKDIIFDGSITTQYKVKIESDSNGGIKISFDKFEENFTFEISVSKDNISEKTAQIINNALRFAEKKQGESLDESTLDYTLSIPGYKEGLQLKGDNVDIFDTSRKTGENQKVSDGKIAVNKWIIDSEGFSGQVAENSSMGINYGIIANSGGYIADGEEGQAVMYNSQGINYGIIGFC